MKTGKPYGFNLVMQTATESSDLINSSNSTRHIYGASYYNMATGLSANQWGYTLDKQSNKFTRVPSHYDTPAVVADVTKAKPAGCTNPANCTKSVTFAANIDPAKLASGSYSTAITYTATAKPAPKPPVVDPTICKSGDPQNDCQVDLDPNMIPVKYTGSTTNAQWTSLANPEDSYSIGEWYNYNQKQWANAVTVKDPSKYKDKRMVVDQSDILGYWVYIPRYAYEVMRRDGTDKPVPAQNFLISFEKTTTPKRYPAACGITGKDYRTECDLNRDYIKGQPDNAGTWATHPAFTFGGKELNGIWFAKFETTGSNTQPTVLPNEDHISGEKSVPYDIGRMYTTAKTFGVVDSNNVGGKTDYTVPSQNNHHLAKLSSHMVNNNDWGAATYLSASKYGAGYNGVQVNANANLRNNSESTTGCGPWSYGDSSTYGDSILWEYGARYVQHRCAIGTPGTQQACSMDNPQRAYNGTIGQLASTTNNLTGIYDMAGGGWEYVAASYSDNLNNSATNEDFGSNAAHPPYVNTYNITNLNNCTFNTCGGQALYETNNGLGPGYNMWLNQVSYFLKQLTLIDTWFARGASYSYRNKAGVFAANGINGMSSYDRTFRVALAPAPHD